MVPAFSSASGISCRSSGWERRSLSFSFGWCAEARFSQIAIRACLNHFISLTSRADHRTNPALSTALDVLDVARDLAALHALRHDRLRLPEGVGARRHFRKETR